VNIKTKHDLKTVLSKAISAKKEDDDVNLGYIGFFMVVIAAISIGVLAVILNRDLTGAALLCGAFLGSAFTGNHFMKKEVNREREVEASKVEPA
jgi:hypothetical protein